MKTPACPHRSKNRSSFLSLTAICVAALVCTAPPFQAKEPKQPKPPKPPKQAKVIAEYTLPATSLTEFGHTDAEIATAVANGLPYPELPAIGSGLQRLCGNHYVSITDRGPTFTRTTPTAARVFPLPAYTPSLVFFKTKNDKVKLQSIVPIVVDDAGTPATGIPNSATDDSIPVASPTATTPLPFNPNGLDLEDVHMLPCGNFIAVDEYSPSLVIISDEGKVLKRYTPAGKPLTGAAYPVSDSLPALLGQRRANRGFEAIAVSDDGRTGYVMTQSPLGSTATGAPTRNSRVLRVLELDLSQPMNIQVSGQYVLLLSDATTYPAGNRPQDLKLSSAAWVSDKKILLLERSDEIGIGGAKLVLADLSNATDITHLAITQTLGLEDSSLDLASVGITPAATKVVYRNEETPEITDFKLEGLSILNKNEIAITNDNDFGIGVTVPLSSKLWIIKLAEKLDRN